MTQGNVGNRENTCKCRNSASRIIQNFVFDLFVWSHTGFPLVVFPQKHRLFARRYALCVSSSWITCVFYECNTCVVRVAKIFCSFACVFLTLSTLFARCNRNKISPDFYAEKATEHHFYTQPFFGESNGFFQGQCVRTGQPLKASQETRNWTLVLPPFRLNRSRTAASVELLATCTLTSKKF